MSNLQDRLHWCETRLLHSPLHGSLINQRQLPRCTVVSFCKLCRPANTQAFMYIKHKHRDMWFLHNQPRDFHLTSKGGCWLNPIFEMYICIYSLCFDGKCSSVTDGTWFWVLGYFAAIIFSPLLCVAVYLAGNVVLTEPCDIEGDSGSLWTQGRHSLPSSPGWGWEGGARPFRCLPAHYVPQITAFLSPVSI